MRSLVISLWLLKRGEYCLDLEEEFLIVFDLPLTREAMSDYLGLTLETVSRQISALKKDGVIHLQGKRHVTVPDFERLLEEAGDDSDGGMLA